MEKPTSFAEAVRYFADLDVATEYVATLRWPEGFVCPHCGSREFSYLSTRRLWKCKICKRQSSVKIATIFESSALGLDKWLPAIWLVANESGLSGNELARELGVTPKSAALMLSRIREARPAAVAPPVVAEPTSPEPEGEGRTRAHPGVFVAIGLAVFALGVLVGRLTHRLTR
jgi:transposase-like protein